MEGSIDLARLARLIGAENGNALIGGSEFRHLKTLWRLPKAAKCGFGAVADGCSGYLWMEVDSPQVMAHIGFGV